MGRPNTTNHRILMLGMALSLVSSTTMVQPGLAISMPGAKKGSSFQLPTADKIDDSEIQDASPEKLPDLSPLSLTKEKAKTEAAGAPNAADNKPEAGTTGNVKTADNADAGKEVLNGNITTSTFVPKGPLEGDNQALLAPTSVKGSKGQTGVSKLGGSLLEQARSVNAAPLPLMDTDEQVEKKADEEREIEKEQLTGLWEAALTRSPEINFVIQKLMPSSDPSKVTTVMMRLLSMAVMTGVGSMQMITPSQGTYIMGQGSTQVLGNLMGIVDSNNAKKAKLTQTEQIQMFMMVRGTADKLVDHYRNYKICHKELHRANSDFEDLKRVAGEIRKNMDASKQLETEYTLRKQQRDIDQIGQNLSKYRQNLVDMSGAEAVAKLDQQIDEEFRKLHPELVPDGSQLAQKQSESKSTDANQADDSKNGEQGPDSGSNFKLPL